MLLRSKTRPQPARTGGHNENKQEWLDKKVAVCFPSNSSECSCVHPATHSDALFGCKTYQKTSKNIYNHVLYSGFAPL